MTELGEFAMYMAIGGVCVATVLGVSADRKQRSVGPGAGS